MMTKTKPEITEKILIGDLIRNYPELARILAEEYGFHCIGCMASGMETLEQGARVHGMNEKEIKQMVIQLRLVEAG